MRWKKILCAVDFSSSAREAMDVAVELATGAAAELVLVHVWQAPISLMGEGVGLASHVISELVSDAEAGLASWKAEAEQRGARVTTVFLSGIAWDEITSMVTRDPTIDLIVIGTHGRTGLERAFLGSVAEKVVRHAACTVLVVRARG